MAGNSGLMRVIYIYTFTLSLSVSPRVCICACMHVQTQASQAYLHKSISEQAGTGRWVVRKCLCSYLFLCGPLRRARWPQPVAPRHQGRSDKGPA